MKPEISGMSVMHGISRTPRLPATSRRRLAPELPMTSSSGAAYGRRTNVPRPPAAEIDDGALLAALRLRDEVAFERLVRRYHPVLLRAVRGVVRNAHVAEEVIQETWLAVLERIGTFEGRSSLKTWLTRIALNRAITRAQREGRSIPFSALVRSEMDDPAPAVDLDRFAAPADDIAGQWRSNPTPWTEEQVLQRETQGVVAQAIEALPPGQRTVITLRDVDGFAADEVCNMLGITETNQRVLLHRARSRVRRVVERHLEAA